VPGGTATGWSYLFSPPSVSSQAYWYETRAYDAVGNSTALSGNFTLSVDAAPPGVTVVAPTLNEVITGSSLTLSGAGTDDVGVTQVGVLIYDRDTSQWWNGSAWQAGFISVDATLTVPGGTATGWSYLFSPPSVSSQAYWYETRSYDGVGNSTALTGNFTLAP